MHEIMFLLSEKETAGVDFYRVCFWWVSLDNFRCLHSTYFFKGETNWSIIFEDSLTSKYKTRIQRFLIFVTLSCAACALFIDIQILYRLHTEGERLKIIRSRRDGVFGLWSLLICLLTATLELFLGRYDSKVTV